MSKGNSREKAGQLKEDCPPVSNLCFGDKTKVKEEGILLNMSQIDDIRDRARKGYRLAEISRATGHDVKTVRKYLEMDDFSPRPPAKRAFPSKLDPYKATIDKWLADDGGTWRKQWHTAQRIHDRLTQEVPGYDCSYSTVQRYVKERRRASGERAFLELTWHPGESQADFGEADFCEGGIPGRRKYLTLSFPFSNNGFSQVFGGETAECVCQGLKDIFAYISGVPPVIVFDNASGVGRRIGEKIIESDLFRRFRCHYGFEVRFCNPDSGHEKGNVERKVAFTRRNLFVPVPAYEDVLAYNRELLDRHREKAAELHYKKGVPISRAVPCRPGGPCAPAAEALRRLPLRAADSRRLRQGHPGRKAPLLHPPGIREAGSGPCGAGPHRGRAGRRGTGGRHPPPQLRRPQDRHPGPQHQPRTAAAQPRRLAQQRHPGKRALRPAR